MPEYRQMTPEILTDYINHWDIGTLVSFERLTAGLANSNYKVVTSKGNFLLKVCEENRLDKIQVQLEALLRLKEYNYPTAYPYPLVSIGSMSTTEYELVNKFALRNPFPATLLFEFCSGVPGENYNSSEEKIYSLGVALGELSSIPAPTSFKTREKLFFPPAESMVSFVSNLKYDNEYYEHPFVTKYLRSRLPILLTRIRDERLPRSITHGDLFLDNCLWSEHQVETILDFEEVCYEPAILDIAMTILGCCFGKDDFCLKINWTRQLLEGFCTKRPLTNLEIEILPMMMEFCIMAAAFWRFNQFNILHPELGMQESWRELANRQEQPGNGSFGYWWTSDETREWIKNKLMKNSQPQKKFISTRGSQTKVSFKEALFTGYADDQGLFVPRFLPKYTISDLESFHKKDYPFFVKRILNDMIDSNELNEQQISMMVDEAFKSFDNKEITPIVRLDIAKENQNINNQSQILKKDDINILEMFHGTTGAFKDLSMTLIGKLIQHFLQQENNDNAMNNKHKTIIVGTSGDTGSAAIHAVRGSKDVDIIVLYPKGRVSRIQELQMTTNTEENVHVFAVDGTSDDLDVPIKAVLSDSKFANDHQLFSINSINLARVVIQSAHYFYCYANLVKAEMIGKSNLIASIPSGACGDLVGGLMAREMGLPVKMIAAVNSNDIIERTMKTGVFNTVEKVVASSSPSMDIQVPYNWERVIYYASKEDTESVAKFMHDFEKNTAVGAQMKEAWIKNLQRYLFAKSVDEDQVAQIVREVYQNDAAHYILDPHTAIGLQAYVQIADKVNPHHFDPVVVFATATPHKFDEYVRKTLSIDSLPNTPQSFQGLEKLESHAIDMAKGQDWEQMLRAKVLEITSKHQAK